MLVVLLPVDDANVQVGNDFFPRSSSYTRNKLILLWSSSVIMVHRRRAVSRVLGTGNSRWGTPKNCVFQISTCIDELLNFGKAYQVHVHDQ